MYIFSFPEVQDKRQSIWGNWEHLILVLFSPTVRTVPALVLLPALFHMCPVPRGVPAGVATLYEYSFAVKAPNLWNCLPSKAVDKDASSLSAFESSLRTFLDKVPDMPPTGQSGANNNSLLDWAKQNFQN